MSHHVDDPNFIPNQKTVISAAILANVFEETPIPFKTNPDGSVDWKVYQIWLDGVREAALFDCEAA